MSNTKKKKEQVKSPKGSRIELDYWRNSTIRGDADCHEITYISEIDKYAMRKVVRNLIHFLASDHTHRTASFLIGDEKLFSLTQIGSDFKQNKFTVTEFETDGTKQESRKISYHATAKLIASTYGFPDLNFDRYLFSDDDENYEYDSENFDDSESFGDFDDLDEEKFMMLILTMMKITMMPNFLMKLTDWRNAYVTW